MIGTALVGFVYIAGRRLTEKQLEEADEEERQRLIQEEDEEDEDEV